MDISVIIVNYNTCDITSACLDSIFKYSKDVSYEVIVVDNNSQIDNSKSVLSKYPGIKYIQSDINLGFGKANNLGFKHSTGKYILLLNSDTYLLNNSLKIFYDYFEGAPEDISCIGSVLLSPSLEPVNSYKSFPTISWMIRNTVKSYLTKLGVVRNVPMTEEIKSETFVSYIVGADLCIRRKVIEKYGLFDEDFFMYFEDVELQKRYSTKGLKSYIISGPRIVHLECASSNKSKKIISFNNRIIFINGLHTYFRKQYPFYAYILFRIFNIVNIPFYLNRKYSFKENLYIVKKFFT